jgi:uncharacterized protein (TIGR00266 family)
MRYEISGTTMQTVAVDLAAGETLYAQTNCMAWMSDNIQMNTHTGGGLFAGIKRSLSGGSLFVTDYSAMGPGHIAFAPRFPGTIVARKLAPNESLICRKETFLCAEKSVMLEIAWQQRIGAGFFGGEGFILQRVTGPGVVWLDLSGELVERDLAPGERLLVHAGHVGIQEPTVHERLSQRKVSLRSHGGRRDFEPGLVAEPATDRPPAPAFLEVRSHGQGFQLRRRNSRVSITKP